MTKGIVFVALVAVLSIFARPASANVEIQAQCGVAAGCVFTNAGDERGSGCAVLALARGDGRQLRAGMVCSGELGPNSTGQAIPVRFESDPLTFCADGSCQPRVEMTNIRGTATELSPSLFMALVVLASAVWVFFDAKKIGARRGLMPGLFDLSPGGWAFATLGIWIAAFPAYLIRRSDIARAVERANQPPTQA